MGRLYSNFVKLRTQQILDEYYELIRQYNAGCVGQLWLGDSEYSLADYRKMQERLFALNQAYHMLTFYASKVDMPLSQKGQASRKNCR